MRSRIQALALAIGLAVVGCAVRVPAPAPAPRYVIGPAYRAGGAWYYPREDFRYEASGLAERIPDHGGLTADGEAFDPTAMAGAHQTLQLPAIVRVTELETGRQALIRVNDRGPANPGRILGLTRRAADLLGVPPSGAARVRVQVETEPSVALRNQLQEQTPGAVAAPRGAVTEETLAPLPGTAQSTRARFAAPSPVPAGSEAPPAEAPGRLPERVEQVPPTLGALWIFAGQFGTVPLANLVRSKLYGLNASVQRETGVRPPAFRVRAGPYLTVPEADAALDRARAAGVTDAQIVVE